MVRTRVTVRTRRIEPDPERMRMSEARPILVIDDDQKLCGLIRDYLEPLGYAVTARHTGREGLDEAVTGDYEAVILDA